MTEQPRVGGYSDLLRLLRQYRFSRNPSLSQFASIGLQTLRTTFGETTNMADSALDGFVMGYFQGAADLANSSRTWRFENMTGTFLPSMTGDDDTEAAKTSANQVHLAHHPGAPPWTFRRVTDPGRAADFTIDARSGLYVPAHIDQPSTSRELALTRILQLYVHDEEIDSVAPRRAPTGLDEDMAWPLYLNYVGRTLHHHFEAGSEPALLDGAIEVLGAAIEELTRRGPSYEFYHETLAHFFRDRAIAFRTRFLAMHTIGDIVAAVGMLRLAVSYARRMDHADWLIGDLGVALRLKSAATGIHDDLDESLVALVRAGGSTELTPRLRGEYRAHLYLAWSDRLLRLGQESSQENLLYLRGLADEAIAMSPSPSADKRSIYRDWVVALSSELPMERVLTFHLARNGLEAVARPLQGRTSLAIADKAWRPRRFANVWLAQIDLPRVNVLVRVGFNIGALPAQSVGTVSRRFTEPDVPHDEDTKIHVFLWADNDEVEVTPAWHLLDLPPSGDTDAVFFHLVPRIAGELLLRVQIRLAREAVLLQELVVPLAVLPEPALELVSGV